MNAAFHMQIFFFFTLQSYVKVKCFPAIEMHTIKSASHSIHPTCYST